ncbi:cysteine--tRNA ligase [bacterium]|nr:cysteine--tRNA ligase [bacterium]
MSIRVFDTYKRNKVEFRPLSPGQLKMYNCGPTVHDFAHIGNLRAYCFADTIRRWFENRGYDVLQVMNITDVDDKTIRKSREKEIGLGDYTEQYRKAFMEDLASLNILPAHVYPNATDHVDDMVRIIETLLEKGHAYRSEDGSIYFNVKSFPEYGNLSGKRIEDLRVGERVRSDEYESKDDVRDFALWKAWDEDDGDVFWETSLGKGRPGWHIECSAMSSRHLGPVFDLHTGGVDNIFPHHENEIAQSRCSLDADFARHWMHVEYLIVEGRKMSKSLGNFFTLRDLLEQGWSAREIRYVLVGTHYRSQLNFTISSLESARQSLARMDDFKQSWSSWPEGESTPEALEALERATSTFDAAMDDDLNVPQALAAVFTFIRSVNALAVEGKTSSQFAADVREVWTRWNHALGLLEADDFATGEEIDSEWVEEQILERQEARKAKDWARADEIRDELLEAGIQLKDGPQGTTWKKI